MSLKCKNPNKNTEDTTPSIWHEEKKATYFFFQISKFLTQLTEQQQVHQNKDTFRHRKE